MIPPATAAGIGHNRGPDLDGETAWRSYVWRRAREDLMPTLPVEVIRLRVRRAAALGLPYRTYAGIRAQTGRDVIGFLFSTNALAMLRATDRPAPAVATQIAALAADRTALVRPPLTPAQVRAALPALDAAHPAPRFTDSWSLMRDRIAAVIRDRGLPPDGLVLVGETEEERDWTTAGRLAAFLRGSEYFAVAP